VERVRAFRHRRRRAPDSPASFRRNLQHPPHRWASSSTTSTVGKRCTDPGFLWRLPTLSRSVVLPGTWHRGQKIKNAKPNKLSKSVAESWQPLGSGPHQGQRPHRIAVPLPLARHASSLLRPWPTSPVAAACRGMACSRFQKPPGLAAPHARPSPSVLRGIAAGPVRTSSSCASPRAGADAGPADLWRGRRWREGNTRAFLGEAGLVVALVRKRAKLSASSERRLLAWHPPGSSSPHWLCPLVRSAGGAVGLRGESGGRFGLDLRKELGALAGWPALRSVHAQRRGGSPWLTTSLGSRPAAVEIGPEGKSTAAGKGCFEGGTAPLVLRSPHLVPTTPATRRVVGNCVTNRA